MLKFFSPPKISTVTADFLDSWNDWRFNFYALDFTHHAFRLLQRSRWFFQNGWGETTRIPCLEFLGIFACLPEAWKAPRTGAAWQVGVFADENCC